MKSLQITFLILVIALCHVAALEWTAERSIHESKLQAHFDEWVGKGYILRYWAGYQDVDDKVYYNTIWHKNAGTTWRAYFGLTEDAYQVKFDEATADGFTPVFVDGFFVDKDSGPRMTCIFHKLTNAPSWSARHRQSFSEYQTHFDDKKPNGYDLAFVSSYADATPALLGIQVPELKYASLFSRYTVDNAWKSHHGMNALGYQEKFDEYTAPEEGYTPRYVSAGTVPGSTGGTIQSASFAAIWEKTNGGPAWVARHNVGDIQAVFDEFIPQGYVPHLIDAYLEPSPSRLMWAVLLYKEGEEMLAAEPNGPTYPETSCFDDKITDFLNANNIPGAAAAVMKDGKLLYVQGYGLRDVPGIGTVVETRKAMPWTPFRLASVSKPVTALAVLRMVQVCVCVCVCACVRGCVFCFFCVSVSLGVWGCTRVRAHDVHMWRGQEGTIGLDDRVFGAGGLLQHYSDNPKSCCPILDARIYDVTVRHLLTHTGGWDRDIAFDPMFRSDTVASTLDPLSPDKPASCEDVIYYMFGQNLQHNPGTVYAYSNFGFCILGRIMAHITGKSYEQAVRTLFLDPAGVDRRQMYVGATQLKDIPGYESEYYCPECSPATSVFPDEPDPVPNPYGGWHLEAMDAHGACCWSARAYVCLCVGVYMCLCVGVHACLCVSWFCLLSACPPRGLLAGLGALPERVL